MIMKQDLIITVDDFVVERVLPEFQPVVHELRRLVKSYLPDVQEIIWRGIPAYRTQHVFAVISPTKKDITFAFTNGARFEDKFGLLRGVGNVSKHLKFKTLAQIDSNVLNYYIAQALHFDT